MRSNPLRVPAEWAKCTARAIRGSIAPSPSRSCPSISSATPDVSGGRWQVSPGGGTKPGWARSGRELFYLDANGAMTAVVVQTMPTFSAESPTKLFDTRYASAVNARSYDVSPDAQRFLMIKEMPAPNQTATAPPPSIVIVLNWHEVLNARLPSN